MTAIKKGQTAKTIPYDNSDGLYPAGTNTVQDALDNLQEGVGTSASPGFSFGRNGRVSSGTWLRRPGNVPSNRAGVTIPIDNPVVKEVSCSNRNIDNYTIELWEHDGDLVNANLLGSVSVINARGDTFSVNFIATKGKQLAIRLSPGSGPVRDIGADVVIQGNI
jgi:hypothetical protein